MSKVFVFLNSDPVDQTLATNKQEAYCPDGGYFDKSLRRFISSKREKRNLLRKVGMREAGELYQPDKYLGGNDGSVRKHGRMRTSWDVRVGRPDHS